MSEPEGSSLRERYIDYLLDRVREDRYPSTAMLDALEAAVQGDERGMLVDVLMDKVEADRFPSIPMLQRIARIVR